MIDPEAKVGDLIRGRLKRACPTEYLRKTYREIEGLAAKTPPDKKARKVKKLVEQGSRLSEKQKGKPRR